MKKKRNLYPVFVVIVFFFFTLLHQTDKLAHWLTANSRQQDIRI